MIDHPVRASGVSPRASEAVNELESSAFPSLPRRGGRAIDKMVPFRRGADGVVNHRLCFAMRSSTCRVVDHPVCGASVASRLFIDAAASPPWQGGENAQTEQSVLSPGYRVIRKAQALEGRQRALPPFQGLQPKKDVY